MALVLEGYPDKKLEADGVGAVRRLVRGRILALSGSLRLPPPFTGSWERDGTLIFCCANQSSADWLKSLSGEMRLEEVPLRVLPADELPKRHRMVVHVEEPDLAVEEAIKLLDKTQAWPLKSGSSSRGV